MIRTRNRPIPSGRISKEMGALTATALAAISMLSYMHFQTYTLIIANAVWLSYTLVYVPMKRVTSLNTLIGAIVGALPPFIGAFAQLGSLYSPEAFYLSIYIFSW